MIMCLVLLFFSFYTFPMHQRDDGELIAFGDYALFYSGLKNIFYITIKSIINGIPTEIENNDNEDEDRYPVLMETMKERVNLQLVCKAWKNIIESDKDCIPFTQKDADIMLRYAVMHNRIYGAQKALQMGANVDTPFKIKQEAIAFFHGATPLFSAVYNKNSDMVKMLLDNNASTNIVSSGMLTVQELIRTMITGHQDNKQCVAIASLLDVDCGSDDTQGNA